MRERAAELGGSCVLEAVLAGGTQVTAHLPLIMLFKEDLLDVDRSAASAAGG
jgi:signal transduction histidine kinase